MDVWEFFHQREKECKQLSLVPDGDFADMCGADDSSDGKRGIFFGRLSLSERAFLNVLEVVRVHGTGIRRERYSYYLVIGGEEIWGYDREPDHDPPTHKHQGASHTRHPCRRMTFHEVAKEARQTTSAEAELHQMEQDNDY